MFLKKIFEFNRIFWCSTKHYDTEYPDSEMSPSVDREAVPLAWENVKEYWRGNREAMPTFGSLLRKVYNKCASPEAFMTSVKPIHTLMQIAESKLESTAKNERVIRALGQVATAQRVSLDDQRVETLVKVSTEVARKFPGKPEKILGYQERPSKVFAKRTEIERKKSRDRMQLSRQKKRGLEANDDDKKSKSNAELEAKNGGQDEDEYEEDEEESEGKSEIESEADKDGKRSEDAGKQAEMQDNQKSAISESNEESESDESFEISENESYDDIEIDEEF